MQLSRCTGHCCRKLFLSWPPGKLEKAYVANRLGVPFMWCGEPQGIPIQIDIIFPMLHFIEREQEGAYYSCRNLLSNGDCGIYPTRPKMCCEYPEYECREKCKFPGCTWSKVRKKKPRRRKKRIHIRKIEST